MFPSKYVKLFKLKIKNKYYSILSSFCMMVDGRFMKKINIFGSNAYWAAAALMGIDLNVWQGANSSIDVSLNRNSFLTGLVITYHEI